MKKIFTLAMACAAALSAGAADFSLSIGNTPVEDGGVYTRNYTLSVQTQQVGDQEVTAYSYKQDADLYLDGAKGRKMVVDVVSDGHALAVCSFGGCEMADASSEYKVVKEGVVDSDHMPLDIHQETTVMNDPTVPALDVIEMTVKVYPQEAPADAITVKVVLSDQPEESRLVAVSSPLESVKLVGRTLSYTVNGNATLSLYTILGGKVMSAPVSGNGSLSLSGLAKGVYLYRVGRASGKVVLK